MLPKKILTLQERRRRGDDEALRAKQLGGENEHLGTSHEKPPPITTLTFNQKPKEYKTSTNKEAKT